MTKDGPLIRSEGGCALEPKEAFDKIAVEGCKVIIDGHGPDTMIRFGCGFLVPANTLAESHMFVNSLGAGHKQHHALDHSDHTAPDDAGWALDAWLIDDDTVCIRCPVDPPRPQDYVYVTSGYADSLELTEDWVEGLNLEL